MSGFWLPLARVCLRQTEQLPTDQSLRRLKQNLMRRDEPGYIAFKPPWGRHNPQYSAPLRGAR